MKYLTVIWATLILALACLPCMDSGEAFAQNIPTTAQADDLHHDEAQGEDLCSPLCDCNCCGVVKLAFHAPQLSELQHSQLTPSLSTYLQQGVANPSFPFWHPPRV